MGNYKCAITGGKCKAVTNLADWHEWIDVEPCVCPIGYYKSSNLKPHKEKLADGHVVNIQKTFDTRCRYYGLMHYRKYQDMFE